ncbi:hypothetical protein ACSBOX_14075 [Arthrobacter sp. KN11-1C]|uniref:hypothetical protein n=1 Tax=Arthrobacter sp. KN11-1C TaxID=3445774 RepID=UPI003F9FDC27
MDRVGINPLSAVRLLLVSGLFVVIWLIFGAGSAHAAEISPADGSSSQPAAAGGLLPSLAGPVTSLLTPAQPPTPTLPSASPVPSASDAVSSTVAPVAGLARQLTEAVPALTDAIAAPVVAPVTQLVPDALQPVSGPVNRLTDNVLKIVAPLQQPLTGVIAPPVASLPTAAGAVETPVSGTAEGALPPRQPATEGSGAVPAATLPASFADSPARGHSSPSFSMAGQGAPLQDPPPAPGGVDPFEVPAPVSNAGGQGQSGAGNPGPAGQGAVADLGYRFVLPVTRDGVGSLFSFVLPGAPAQETGFSPD